MTSQCPEIALWERLADGQIADSEHEVLWRHLGECPTCRRIAAGLLRAAASEAHTDPAPKEELERFRDAFLQQVREACRGTSFLKRLQPVVLKLKDWGPGLLAPEPVLVGEGETDSWTLQAELPTYVSADESVMLRLRRERSSGRLLAYVISEAQLLSRWCSLVLEPSGKEFVTNEEGVCEITGVEEADFRASSFKVRPPAVRFTPEDPGLVITGSWTPGSSFTLKTTGEIRWAIGTPRELLTAAMRITPHSDGRSADLECRLPEELLQHLAPSSCPTVALMGREATLYCRLTAPHSEWIRLGQVSLPISPLELRIFLD